MEWQRQENESDKAYQAFKIYLESENRSLQKVAKSLHKDPTLIRRWSAKYDWRKRAAAYDSSILEEVRKSKIRQRQKDIELQSETGRNFVKKALEVLKNTSAQKGSFYSAVQMAELGFKLVNEAYDFDTASEKENSEITINIKRAIPVTCAYLKDS